MPSRVAIFEYETSVRSAPRQKLSESNSRRRPLASHSSRSRRSACSVTVAAQRKSKSRSGDHDSSAVGEMDNREGAAAIQSSQEMKSTFPPRLHASLVLADSRKKFCNAFSRSARN